MAKIKEFLRLARLHFLLGGAVLYCLGALYARFLGFPIDWGIYVSGQLAVILLQLMGHYINEYSDFEVDRINQNRTLFSGGSGVLQTGVFQRETALHAALACLFLSMLTMLFLFLATGVHAEALIIFAFGILGTWLYSGPPLSLEKTGIGELEVSIMLSIFLPMLSFNLQTGMLGLSLMPIIVPLVLLSWSMLMIFDIPDIDADLASGKLTIVVRLGIERSGLLIIGIILAAYTMLAFLILMGYSYPALFGLLSLPVALFTIWMVGQTRRKLPLDYSKLTFSAVSMFFVAASLIVVGIILAVWTI